MTGLPSRVGTLSLVPRAASAKVTGTASVRLLAVAAEHRVRLDVHDDEQVAGRAAVAAGTAPALEPDALAVGDAGGDADLDLARPRARRPSPGTWGTGR